MAKLYFPGSEESQKASRRVISGELHRIRPGIYITTHDPEEITRALNNEWMDVASYLFPEPVAVARTAVELKPAEGRLYFVSSQLKQVRTVKVGHLKFDIAPGNTTSGVEQFSLNMKRSNPARYCLENLVFSRGPAGSKKTLGKVWVESELIRIIRRGGEQGINALRDEARSIAGPLGLVEEFSKLDALISALLKTGPAKGVLQTSPGFAEAKGEPFDPVRLQRFQELTDYLKALDLQVNAYKYNRAGWRNLTFFESYFSNYIEGTEFSLEEAEEIAFEKKEIYARHQDSHDILAHIEISEDMSEMNRVPSDAVELIDILQFRHGILLAERADKRPGMFKQKPNKAGGTDFVLPELLEGTLVQGFAVYQSLPAGMIRAIFMHFLISECHPFDDGNGRLARIMMNAELVSQDQYKVIIPIVHRESYLNGLRSATRQGRFRVMVKVLHQMQCYTASLDWNEYAEVKATLQKDAADKEPDEGITIFNKVIAKLGGQYPAG
ncbi:MAG: Fic family protein [Proteobacteria bacterium]|nr:Fic family protein [Pseudomonadota bacterium]